MTAILLVAPDGSALHKFYLSWSRAQPDHEIIRLKQLGAVQYALAGRPFGVMLLDGTLPKNELCEVLQLAASDCPGLIRLMVAAAVDDSEGQFADAHQVLPLRDDLDYLGAVVESALSVSGQLFTNVRLAKLISGLRKLPSPPMLYFDLRDELERDRGDLPHLAAITARDPALVAQVLKIANSGFYALPGTVSNLTDAIRMLGTDTLLSLVLAAHIFSGMPPPGMRLEVLWQHCARVSSLSRQIAALEGADLAVQEVCAIAGMLHDIGLLVLFENDLANYQPLWKRSAGNEAVLAELERDSYGVSHGELGALVLALWALPKEIVSAVSSSHSWDAPAEAPVARAVMAAEWLLDIVGAGMPHSEELPAFLDDRCRQHLELWFKARDDIKDRVA